MKLSFPYILASSIVRRHWVEVHGPTHFHCEGDSRKSIWWPLLRPRRCRTPFSLLASFFHCVVDVVEAHGSQQILTGNGALLDRSGGLLVGQTRHETLSPKLVGTLCTVLPPLTVLGPDATCADVKMVICQRHAQEPGRHASATPGSSNSDGLNYWGLLRAPLGLMDKASDL